MSLFTKKKKKESQATFMNDGDVFVRLNNFSIQKRHDFFYHNLEHVRLIIKPLPYGTNYIFVAENPHQQYPSFGLKSN
jgi:hypothetical protein